MALLFSRPSILAITLFVGACAPSLVLPASSPSALDPIAFFKGHTHGDGHLEKLFGSPVDIAVEGVGRTEGDTFILDQTIRESDKPPQARRWTMRRVSANGYSGTLTDATGDVRITVSGARAYIRYDMKGGLHVRQQLALQSDGSTILNRLEVRKFGLRVATLNETIRKVP